MNTEQPQQSQSPTPERVSLIYLEKQPLRLMHQQTDEELSALVSSVQARIQDIRQRAPKASPAQIYLTSLLAAALESKQLHQRCDALEGELNTLRAQLQAQLQASNGETLGELVQTDLPEQQNRPSRIRKKGKSLGRNPLQDRVSPPVSQNLISPAGLLPLKGDESKTALQPEPSARRGSKTRQTELAVEAGEGSHRRQNHELMVIVAVGAGEDMKQRQLQFVLERHA